VASERTCDQLWPQGRFAMVAAPTCGGSLPQPALFELPHGRRHIQNRGSAIILRAYGPRPRHGKSVPAIGSHAGANPRRSPGHNDRGRPAIVIDPDRIEARLRGTLLGARQRTVEILCRCCGRSDHLSTTLRTRHHTSRSEGGPRARGCVASPSPAPSGLSPALAVAGSCLRSPL
jgi:hypothetical protein